MQDWCINWVNGTRSSQQRRTPSLVRNPLVLAELQLLEHLAAFLDLVLDPEDLPGAEALFRPVLSHGVSALRSRYFEFKLHRFKVRESIPNTCKISQHSLEGLRDSIDLVAHDDVVVEGRAGAELSDVAQAVGGLENAADL